MLATRLGGEFLPKLSEGSIVITSEKLPGIDLSASLATVGRIERVLKSFPEVKRVVSLTGSAEIPTDPMGVESTDSFITLTDPATWKTAGGVEVTGYAAHAFGKTVRGNGSIPPGNPPGGFGGGNADVRLKETILGVSFGWAL